MRIGKRPATDTIAEVIPATDDTDTVPSVMSLVQHVLSIHQVAAPADLRFKASESSTKPPEGADHPFNFEVIN